MADHGFAQHVEARWSDAKTQAGAHDELQRHGFIVLRDFITPQTLAFTRTRLAKIEPGLPLGDHPEIPGRKYQHNEPFFRILHQIITPPLQAVVGAKIKPSYCFLGVYQPGADLFRHVDREQCAWNVSIAFDCDPPITERGAAWPIFLEKDGVAHRLQAGLGDAVLYPGTKYPHWREPLPPPFTRYAVCFFHFVEPGFEGKLS